MDLDGSGVELVQEAAKQLRYPAWSPDGNFFAFTAWEDDGTLIDAVKAIYFHDMRDHKLYMVDLDGRLDVLGEPWPPLSWTP
jgi:hypothetical protein